MARPGVEVSGLSTLRGYVGATLYPFGGGGSQQLQEVQEPCQPGDQPFLPSLQPLPQPGSFSGIAAPPSPPTCMGADVALEQPGSGEGLAAHLTDAGQSVGADMHLESTQAGILLVTVPAGEGSPSWQVTVQLLMSSQSSQRVIWPVAVDALKATWDSRCPLSPKMSI